LKLFWNKSWKLFPAFFTNLKSMHDNAHFTEKLIKLIDKGRRACSPVNLALNCLSTKSTLFLSNYIVSQQHRTNGK
jgi:hypothetical protein